MQWASVLATTARLEDAAREASEALAAELGARPDLVMAFFTRDYLDHAAGLAPCLREHLDPKVLIGCSAGGVIGGGVELEGEPGLALVGAVLPGVELSAFHIDGGADTWREAIGAAPEDEPELVVFPDPYTCRVEALLGWLDQRFPDSTVLGGVASAADQPGENVLILGGDVHRTGCVGVALWGDIEVDSIVSQGCRPIGVPMFVTRAEGHVLRELDGQPAVAAIEELMAALPAEDRALARSALFLGIGMREAEESYEHGDFLIRNVVGVDPRAGALVIAGAQLAEGKVVQFHLRDATASRDDLAELLTRHQYGSPTGALLFSCLGRGRGLYGRANHDSELFHRQMGPVPLGGFFCAGEIGPVQGKTFVHGYTSSFGLFRKKSA